LRHRFFAPPAAAVLTVFLMGAPSVPWAAPAPGPGRGEAGRARRDGAGAPTPVAPFILALDPGHGGRDAGSRGSGPLLEKDFTLRVARLLAERLRLWPEIKVVLTREGDTEVTAVQRTALANHNGASLFLSIQADASWRPGARGPSILIAAPQRPPRVEGEPLEAVALRWQRGQNVHLAESLRFAQSLQARFAAIQGGHKPPILSLSLQALEGARMPAVYLSLGVISTSEEAARLREMDAENPYLAAIAAEVARFTGLPEAPPGQDAAPPLGGGAAPPPGETPSAPPKGEKN